MSLTTKSYIGADKADKTPDSKREAENKRQRKVYETEPDKLKLMNKELSNTWTIVLLDMKFLV